MYLHDAFMIKEICKLVNCKTYFSDKKYIILGRKEGSNGGKVYLNRCKIGRKCVFGMDGKIFCSWYYFFCKKYCQRGDFAL